MDIYIDMDLPYRRGDPYVEKLIKRMQRLEQKFKQASCNSEAEKYLNAVNVIKAKLNQYKT